MYNSYTKKVMGNICLRNGNHIEDTDYYGHIGYEVLPEY